jgi:hypothetical protein
MAAALRLQLEGVPADQADAIIETLRCSLQPGTIESYGSHFARFVRFCSGQPDSPCPLPATTTTVLRWLSQDVCRDHRVHADSLQPYLSALNRIHADIGFDRPAVGPLITQFRHGRAHQYTSGGQRKAQRVYLPPDAVERAMVWALELDVEEADWELLQRFRAACAVVFAFVFGYRGASGAGVRACDVRRSDAGITLSLAREKGKAAQRWARSITVPPGAVPGLEELLYKWEEVRGDASGETASYFAFDFETEARSGFTSRALDTWLQLILSELNLRPPDGEAWSGHSLRKGAASGMAALGVSLDRICFVGGWSIRSAAVRDYIDPTCPCTPACRRFYGWLLPG